MPLLDISYDASEWKPLLAAWDEKQVTKTLRRAASEWGRAAKPVIAAETPIGRPGNTYARGAGNLRKTVKFKRIRARYGIGVVVGPIGKLAYYRHMVTGGTKPHLILPKEKGSRSKGTLAQVALRIASGQYVKAVQHPGAKANPFIERAAPAAESAGHERAEAFIFKALAEAQAVTEATE